MNNKNKILIGCLALLLALSVGYALFSDTITINGTATAKGNFEITAEIMDLNDYPNLIGDGISKGIVENPQIDIKDNRVTSSVTLGSPGSHHYFGIKFKNTGSIPAKLSSIIDKTNNYTIIDKNSDYEGPFEYSLDGSTALGAMLWIDDGWYNDYINDYPITDRMIINWIEPQILEAVLDPEEEFCVLIQYFWTKNSTEQDNIPSLDWNLEINWQQVTTE